jgi:hypothetical protein
MVSSHVARGDGATDRHPSHQRGDQKYPPFHVFELILYFLQADDLLARPYNPQMQPMQAISALEDASQCKTYDLPTLLDVRESWGFDLAHIGGDQLLSLNQIYEGAPSLDKVTTAIDPTVGRD